MKNSHRKNITEISSISENKVLSNHEMPWISASETRNFALNDPLLDWLNLTSDTRTDFSPFVNYIMSRGVEFESKVVQYLREKFTVAEFKQVVNNISTTGYRAIFNDDNMMEYYRQTLRFMQENVPIIYQGVLLDNDKHIVGVPDFIIRSDYLRKLVSHPPLIESDEKSPCTFSSQYHYVIVDCKWSTLSFCADGITLRNEGSMNAYKCQLACYQHCLELIQKSGKNLAFILGKRWKGNGRTFGNGCFDRLGTIDYGAKDCNFMNMMFNAVQWLQDLKIHGKEWHLYPTPSRNELYPNMNNTYDDPWHSKKIEIAEKLYEITNIWNCKTSNRDVCFQQGIYGWNNMRCNSQTLGINGKIIGPVVDAILNVNRSTTDTILPQILNSGDNFIHPDVTDYYVDFEFITMLGDSLETFPSAHIDGIVYLIGTGWYENDEWQYKSFMVDRLAPEYEKYIFSKWIDFLVTHSNNKPLRLFHWGSAENTWFLKHTNKCDENIRKVLDFKFIDVLDMIKKIPITFKNAFGFGLKEVGSAMYKNGHISIIWPEINNALDTITHINALQEQARIECKSISELTDTYQLIKYNETDCRIMAEILGYLSRKYKQPTDPINVIDKNSQSNKIDIDEIIDDDYQIKMSHNSKKQKIIDAELSMENKQCGYNTRSSKNKRKADNDVEINENDKINEIKIPENIENIENIENSQLTESTEACDENSEIVNLLDDLQEKIDEEMEILKSVDLGRIVDILNYIKQCQLTSFQKIHVMQQLRILVHTEMDTTEFFTTLESLSYYLGIHPAHNINNYSDTMDNPEQMKDLGDILEIHKKSNIDFSDIFKSNLSTKEKVELYDKLISLRVTTVPYSEEYYRIRDKIRQQLDDDRHLTFEQREMLRQTQTDVSTYMPRILESKWDVQEKKYLLAKYHNMLNLADDDPDKRKEINILDYALRIPMGASEKHNGLEFDSFVKRCYEYLDANIYGMTDIKREFVIQMYNHFTRPKCLTKNKIIAICGSPGIGKSTFATSVSVAFNKPKYVIKMAGISDAGTFIGHTRVYIGSDIGSLARAKIEMGADDGIIVLDEIDKISTTRDGDDIANTVIQLLDPAFNDKIIDKFLGLPVSFRHVTFLATLNDMSQLHPALRDRLNIFILPDPIDREKRKIAEHVIVPRILSNFGFTINEVIFTPDILSYILQKSKITEKGVRQYERNIESIVSRLDMIRNASQSVVRMVLGSDVTHIRFPIELTTRDIDLLFFEPKGEESKVHRYIS